MKKLLALAFVLLLVLPGALPAQVSHAKSSTLPEVKTYDQLLAAIRQTRAASEARVQAAVEQEKVREAWETGKLIDEHILQHKERADYGKQVIVRLAKDLGMSDTELRYMLEFARAYPIYPHAGKLSWSEYRELLAVNEPQKREALAERTEKENWDRTRLRAEVKALKQGQVLETKADLPLSPLPLGKPGTYRYVKATVGPEAGRGVIDLGFSNWYRTSRDLGYEDGSIIETLQAFPEGSSPSDKVRLSRRTADDLYTYRAWIVSILDGDTVKAVVDLGFGVRSVQVLRLRGLDAPEILTGAGKEAKSFVEKTLQIQDGEGRMADGETSGSVIVRTEGTKQSQAGSPVLIKTLKSDKYDRYLADIWVDKDGKQVYLNNLLLQEGLAVRVHD